MKLIVAIVSGEDSFTLSKQLTKHGFQNTKISSTGGFLRVGNTTFLIGCEEEAVDQILEIIKQESKKRVEIVPSTSSNDFGRYSSFPIEVTVGGATVFVLDIEKNLKF